jgi:hypothetical protein
MTPEQRATVTKWIGPIHRTLESDPLGSGCFLVAAVIVVAFFGLTLLNLPVEHWASIAGVMLVLLGLVPALALLFFYLQRRLPVAARDCLLVGEGGLAEVRGGDVTILLWSELGVTWRPLPLAFDAAHSVDPIVLLLEREDGTRFRLRSVYPGVRAVRLLIGRYLRRQQEQRAVLVPRPVVEERRVRVERPSPGIFGPWIDSDADHFIGPVRQVCPLRAGVAERVQEQVDRSFALGVLTSSLLLLGSVAGCVAVPGFGGAGAVLFFIALASFLASLASRAHRLWPLRSFLLLGEHGVALWHPGGSRIVPWDDLGSKWCLDPDITSADRAEVGPGILLKLRHADGPCFFITDLYENALFVVARVREELQRVRPVDRPRRALRQRGPASKAIRAPAHFSETPPLPAWSPLPGTTAEDVAEFVCAPPQEGRFLLIALLVVLLVAGFTIFAAFDLVSCGLLGAGLFALAGLVILVGRGNTGRWLVGATGLTYEDATRTEVLRWDDLGTGWRVFFLDQDGTTSPRLVFLLPDGTELSVSPYSEGVERLEMRIRARLARRLDRPATEEP